MSSGLIGSLVAWLIVAVVAIAIVAYLLNWLYHRSSKQIAFVRTGFGGETVVINGGALVLPIIHEVTPVNLAVVRIPVTRTREHAVMSRDRMRVDIEAEFFVRVQQSRDAVATAAATLGQRTLEADALAELLSGKFVGALRSVAAEMTLDEMHEQRASLVERVAERASDALARNGLELESVAITDLDQAELDFFDPANRFDAEGLTQLIDSIESRRRLRNDIEQSAMIAIRSRNLEAEKESLALERESESSRLDQQKAIEGLRAAQAADIERSRAEAESGAEQARIESTTRTRRAEIEQRLGLETRELEAQEALERARLAREQAVETARVERESSVRRAEIAERHGVDAAEVETNEAIERARISAEREVRSERVMAEREVETREIERNQALEAARIAAHRAVEEARTTEEQVLDRARIERDQALRTAQIAQAQAVDEHEIAANEEVERARVAAERGLDEARITLERDRRRLEIARDEAVELATLDRQIELHRREAGVAAARVEAEQARASAVSAEEAVATTREQAVAERIAAIDRLIAEKDADTARVAAEAARVSAAVTAETDRLRNEAENVLSDDARAARLRSQMIDRLEAIVRESVKPMEKIEGIRILQVDGLGNGGGSAARSPTDEVIESALRYRAQAPLIDQMMKEIGVEEAGVARMGDVFRAAKDAQSIAQGTKKAAREPSGGD